MMPRLKKGGFYAVAVEQEGELTIARESFFDTPLTARTLKEARQMRNRLQARDDLSILRCEPIE